MPPVKSTYITLTILYNIVICSLILFHKLPFYYYTVFLISSGLFFLLQRMMNAKIPYVFFSIYQLGWITIPFGIFYIPMATVFIMLMITNLFFTLYCLFLSRNNSLLTLTPINLFNTFSFLLLSNLLMTNSEELGRSRDKKSIYLINNIFSGYIYYKIEDKNIYIDENSTANYEPLTVLDFIKARNYQVVNFFCDIQLPNFKKYIIIQTEDANHTESILSLIRNITKDNNIEIISNRDPNHRSVNNDYFDLINPILTELPESVSEKLPITTNKFGPYIRKVKFCLINIIHNEIQVPEGNGKASSFAFNTIGQLLFFESLQKGSNYRFSILTIIGRLITLLFLSYLHKKTLMYVTYNKNGIEEIQNIIRDKNFFQL